MLEAAARVDGLRLIDPEAVTTRDLRGTLVHQLDVEWSRPLRWQGRGEADALRDEDFPNVAALAARWREDEREMRAHLAGLQDQDPVRPFALGSAYPLPLWRFLFHVVNHGTQQRSDAAVLLTRCGHSPGDLDFADFAREPSAAASHPNGG